MAFLVQWFTWLVTTTTKPKPLSLNSLELLIILVYPVECGPTREWRMEMLIVSVFVKGDPFFAKTASFKIIFSSLHGISH